MKSEINLVLRFPLHDGPKKSGYKITTNQKTDHKEMGSFLVLIIMCYRSDVMLGVQLRTLQQTAPVGCLLGRNCNLKKYMNDS